MFGNYNTTYSAHQTVQKQQCSVPRDMAEGITVVEISRKDARNTELRVIKCREGLYTGRTGQTDAICTERLHKAQ